MVCQIRKKDDPLWIGIVNDDDRVTDKLSLQTLRVCLMFHGTQDDRNHYLTMKALEDVEENPQLKDLRELPNYVTLTPIVEEKQLQIIPGIDLVKLQGELLAGRQAIVLLVTLPTMILSGSNTQIYFCPRTQCSIDTASTTILSTTHPHYSFCSTPIFSLFVS